MGINLEFLQLFLSYHLLERFILIKKHNLIPRQLNVQCSCMLMNQTSDIVKTVLY